MHQAESRFAIEGKRKDGCLEDAILFIGPTVEGQCFQTLHKISGVAKHAAVTSLPSA